MNLRVVRSKLDCPSRASATRADHVRSFAMTLRLLSALSLALAAFTAVAANAWAEDSAAPSPDPADKHGVLSLTSENDLYALHNKDRHYTNGIRLGWMSEQDTEWARGIGDW